jgi:hypothetical protein
MQNLYRPGSGGAEWQAALVVAAPETEKLSETMYSPAERGSTF